jgi:dTDP-4-amino-4,6-dideoxygalactose transaminase
MQIKANRLDRGFYRYQTEIEEAALRVLRSGWYVLGKEVQEFEREFADHMGVKHCVGLASGLDALWIAFRLLGIGKGDEVIVPSNTYIASVMGVSMNDATPVFVEPDEYHNIDPDKIEFAITSKTKAILPVHLYGQSCDMERIMKIAKKQHIYVVEDCAQSHGASYKNKKTGTYGDIGCFSFYPSKNLGAFGDAGAIVTDNDRIAQMFRVFRNYGSEKRYYNMMIGANSRLDEIQAAMLRVRLRHLEDLNAERRNICSRYLSGIRNPAIVLPKVRSGCETVWHQFVIRIKSRRRFVDYLAENNIATQIHYPIPPHMQKAYEYLGLKAGEFEIAEKYADEILSLPLYNGMTEEELDYVIKVINRYV